MFFFRTPYCTFQHSIFRIKFLSIRTFTIVLTSQLRQSRFMQTERTRFSMKLYPTSNLSEEEGHHSSSPSVPSPKKTTFLPSSSSFPIALQCHWLNLLVKDWQRHKTQVSYLSGWAEASLGAALHGDLSLSTSGWFHFLVLELSKKIVKTTMWWQIL